jgi:TRAP-type mannitol/chloroaromatic compound transport system permease small subunit
MQPVNSPYAVRFDVHYPDADLNRLTSFFRVFVAIPILIVLATVSGGSLVFGGNRGIALAGGLLFAAPLLMIVFREKYPRWWFDWNLQLLRFENRVAAFLLLLRDEYPATDDEQHVRLDVDYPNVGRDLNRWLPLVKWFLAIPHYVVLLFLTVGVLFVAVIAWFAILFTGQYPRWAFDYVVGVMRWHNRVFGYAIVLVTDQYPPFRLT